jgi:hypothetical protein
MILHVVFYQPRESATAEELSNLVSSLEAASLEIPSIRQVRVGKAIDLGMGYGNRSISLNLDYCAIYEFDDVIGLTTYLLHQAHKRLGELFWSVCEKTMIVDVEAVDPRHPGLSELLVK